MSTATALAHPNIAFIKYWGNRDLRLRLPSNGSISMNLGGLHTRTTVTFQAGPSSDQVSINGKPADPNAHSRVRDLLDRVRSLSGSSLPAVVISENNFPAGAGIASSASAFAALALAACAAAGLNLSQPDLSRLARTGSGSACRSVPGGFAEWLPGQDDRDSYAASIAPADHWDLVDCVAVVSTEHKAIGSTQGHALAETSPLQAARIADSPRRLDLCREAILGRDFDTLARISELDSNLMHAVMMTSSPPLLYWLPASMAIMQAVHAWRAAGIPCFYTLDAGPNVHVICPTPHQGEIVTRLQAIQGVLQVLTACPGGPARLLLN